MLKLYKKAAIVFASLTLASALLGWYCWLGFFGKENLLTNEKNLLQWTAATHGDQQGSSITALNHTPVLNFRYTLSDKLEYPFVRMFMIYNNPHSPGAFVDLSPYHQISFLVRCSSYNFMTFSVRTFDPKVTRKDDIESYRMASERFNCFDSWSKVELDPKAMEVPLWWLESYGAEVHDWRYPLNLVHAISFDSSRRGIVGAPVNVQITELSLHRHRWAYAALFLLLFFLAWSAFVLWLFKQHSRWLTDVIKQKIVQDKPLLAYQQLSLEPHKVKERSAVLQYLAQEYTNPELNQEMLMRDLGINSKKVNEILKDALGFTFRAYLNKLRLTEAARLVRENPAINISEIAFSVGYKNVTHFNKIFKDEYACSPKKFKTLKINRADNSRPE